MQLNYYPLLPLKQIVLRKLVVLLWDTIDILAENGVHWHPQASSVCPELIDDSVKLIHEKLEHFRDCLPISILNELLPLIEPIVFDIIYWINFHVKFLNYPHIYFECQSAGPTLYRMFSRNVLLNLAWTPIGSINYKKTAQKLIRGEILNIFSLYKMACLYCLENCILDLWEKLPDVIKAEFCDERDVFQTADQHLNAFWTKIIRRNTHILDDIDEGQFENIPNFYRHALEMSAYTRNVAATEYFYQKLTDVEKEILLLETAETMVEQGYGVLDTTHSLEENEYGVICYFLSEMTPVQRLEFFEAHAYDILERFLVWPWCHLFLDFAGLMWDFFPKTDFRKLLYYFYENDNLHEYLNWKIFREYFEQAPRDFKNYFMEEECLHGEFLCEFYLAENISIVRFIFHNIDIEAKAKFAFSNQGELICIYLIQEENWHFLKQLIQDTRMSEEDKEKLEEYWKPYISDYWEESESKILEWEKIFESEGNSSCKRSLEDEKDDKVKKYFKHAH